MTNWTKWYIKHCGMVYAETFYTKHNNKRKALQEWREHHGCQGVRLNFLEIWRA